MTDEERRIIGDFVARMAGYGPAVPGPAQASPWGAAPATEARPPLPPVEPMADQFIGQLFQQYPEARYRITQTAFIQEAALVEAQNHIRQLEWERDQARAQAQQVTQQAQAAPRQGGGFLGGLFGGGQRPAAPPAGFGQQPGYAPAPAYAPPPQYPPGYNPQAFAPQQQQGPSFLGGALRTAAGVAGGMVVGNMLMNAFSQHHGQDATAAAGAAPWGGPSQLNTSQGWDAGGPMKDQGYLGQDKFAAAPDPGYAPDATPASWSGGGGDDGGGSDWGGGDSGGGNNDC